MAGISVNHENRPGTTNYETVALSQAYSVGDEHIYTTYHHAPEDLSSKKSSTMCKKHCKCCGAAIIVILTLLSLAMSSACFVNMVLQKIVPRTKGVPVVSPADFDANVTAVISVQTSSGTPASLKTAVTSSSN